VNPKRPPKTVVITTIGINAARSFQPIKIAVGSKTKYEIRIPFIIECIFKSTTDIKKPIITHIIKAEILAYQVNFILIIGITSKIPAGIPKIIPVICFFMTFNFYIRL